MSTTALITGGSSGLGFEFARQLGANGYDIILVARNKGKLDKAAGDLVKQGITVVAYAGDITDDTRLTAIAKKIKATGTTIDFLVLNAGVVTPKLLTGFKDAAELKHDLNINLWGTILSAQIFLPMVNRGGKVLMISSAFGLMAPAAYSVYTASKAGVINFAESVRRELLCKQISVHVACPADIDTPQLHEEHKNMPDWFKDNDPRTAISPALAARKILKKCDKKTFIIIIQFEIHMLNLMNKLLPRRMRDFFLDRMFPVPGESDYDY
ncbi:SDR family NAD(P)-dependent oxidoreductase [Candidatus Latescibacterota bacterium]